MAKIIKNVDSVAHTYAGQVIEPGGSYTIQGVEKIIWSNDDDLMADIGSGKAIVNDGTNDIVGVSNQINFLKDIDNSPRDPDAAMVIRLKAAKSGWTYQLRAIELETSQLNSLNNKDHNGNNIGDCTIKFYDSNNNELTTQQDCDSSCVKTVVDFEPVHDYEIIGGTLKTVSGTADDYRVFIVAVPDIPAQYGGSKIMVNNVNLKFIDANNGIEADGKVSKYMAYSAIYHTNKIRLIVLHPTGGKLKMMLAFELFKE